MALESLQGWHIRTTQCFDYKYSGRWEDGLAMPVQSACRDVWLCVVSDRLAGSSGLGAMGFFRPA